MTAAVKPAASMALRPRMVMPPGVVTRSISASGWVPRASSRTAAPLTVWSAAATASRG